MNNNNSLIGAIPDPNGLPISIAIPAYSLIIFEFIVDFLCIFASILNIHLVWKTSVLHCNLKCILLCHCFFLLANALIKVFFTIPIKFISGDVFWLERLFRPSQILIYTIVYARIILSFVFVFERTLATIYAKNYGRLNWTLFQYAWPILMVILVHNYFGLFWLNFIFVFANVFIQQQQSDSTRSSLLNLFISLTVTALSCIEIFVFAILWKINNKKCKLAIDAQNNAATATTIHRKSYDLAERYQYLENNRTSLQLAPTMFLYLLNSLNSAFLSVYIKFYIQDADTEFMDELIMSASILLNSIFNFLMPITTICFHPILRRNCVPIFEGIIRKNRIQPSPKMETSKNGTNSASQDMEEHFRILAKYWAK